VKGGKKKFDHPKKRKAIAVPKEHEQRKRFQENKAAKQPKERGEGGLKSPEKEHAATCKKKPQRKKKG